MMDTGLLAIVIRRSVHIPNTRAADHLISCRELRGALEVVE